MAHHQAHFAFSLIDTILFQKTYTGSHFFVVASQVGVVLEDALWFCLNYNSPVNHFGGALNQYFGYVLTLFFSGLGWGFAYLILGWSASGLFTTIGCQFGVCLLFSLLVLRCAACTSSSTRVFTSSADPPSHARRWEDGRSDLPCPPSLEPSKTVLFSLEKCAYLF